MSQLQSTTSMRDTALFNQIMRLGKTLDNNTATTASCAKCDDTGWINTTKDGYEYSSKCECLVRKQSLERLKSSGINNYIGKTLENYLAVTNEQKAIKKLASEYIASDTLSNFVICGKSGTGKTHIASAILVTKIKKGRSGKYISYKEFVRTASAKARSWDEEEYFRYFRAYANPTFLLIDDLFKGSEKTKEVNPAHLTYMYELINHRYSKGLATIITSELSIDDLIGIDEALTGRLLERAGENVIQIQKIENQRLSR